MARNTSTGKIGIHAFFNTVWPTKMENGNYLMGRIEILRDPYALQHSIFSGGAHFQPVIRNFLLMDWNSPFFFLQNPKNLIWNATFQSWLFWGFFVESKIQNHTSLSCLNINLFPSVQIFEFCKFQKTIPLNAIFLFQLFKNILNQKQLWDNHAF